MTMDLSEFKPPVRLSMTDEEIFVALGNAEASEDGLARAMAIVEEQANLREHDNKLFAEWVERMRASENPLAQIALENVERAKHGLEPLPLVAPIIETEPEPLPEPSSQLQQDVQEILEQVEVVEVEIPVVDDPRGDSDDLFDALLADAAAEATGLIPTLQEHEVPAVTYSHDIIEESVPAFAVSADEDALVVEEKAVSSGWWNTLSVVLNTTGLLLPVVLAYLTATAEISFGTAVFGFGLGTLGQLGLFVASHFASKRTQEPVAVTRRATFGVFGAILPGISLLGLGLSVLALVAIGVAGSLNGAVAGLPVFSSKAVAGLSFGTLAALVLLVAGFVAVISFGRLFKYANAVVAAGLLVGFIVIALGTRANINLSNVSFYVDANQVTVIAVLVTLVGVVGFNSLPKLGSAYGKINTVWRWAGVTAALVVVPSAVFAHFELLFAQNAPATGFDLLNVLIRDTSFGTVSLWFVIFATAFAIANFMQQSLGNLRLLGLNRVSVWWSIALVLATVLAVALSPSWAFWLEVGRLLIVPAAAATGMAIAETMIRRGAYHEASLLRAYGFYRAIGWVGLLGFVASTTLGWATLSPTVHFNWLGFSGWVSVFAPAIALVAGLLWVGIAMVPVIFSQQRAVAEVEERKASLTGFSGFSE
jgi:hypothetical protein